MAELLAQGEAILESLAGPTRSRSSTRPSRPPDSAVAVLADVEVILPLEGLIDKQAERAKLQEGTGRPRRQIGPLQAKLAMRRLSARAPAEVVDAQRTKLAELEPSGPRSRPSSQNDCQARTEPSAAR